MFFNKPDLTNLPAYEEPEEAMSPASFSEAWKTADQAWKSDFYVSQHFNLYDAYAEHNKRVKELTGKDLPNPEDYNSRILDVDQRQELSKAFDSYKSEGGDMGFDWFQHKWYEDDYRKKLDELKAEFPDKAGEILPETSFRSQAFQRRRDYVSERAAIEERSQFLQNPLGWAGRIAGGLTSMRYDPTFYFTLPFGFGAGTGARAVLMAGAKNGAVNAATELGAQFAPGGVMEQNRAAGIDYTATDALKVAGFAGLAGAGLDVLVRSGTRGIRTAFGHVPVVKDGIVVGWRAKGAHAKVEPLEHVPEVPADLKERAASGDKAAQEEVNRIIDVGKPKDAPTISNETMAKAVEGDGQALREVYAEGAKSDPVTRAMVEAMEADDRLAVKPLDTIDDATHAETVTQAIRHVDNPEAEPFPVRVDEAPQVPGVSDKINAEIARLKAEIATKPDNVELRSQVMELEAQIKAIDSFGSDPVGDALRLRDNPALLTTDVDTSLPGVRQTRALASLSREAFDMVQGGRATPELGQLVADYVAKPEMQAPILADLVKMRPVSAIEGRRMVNELLRSPEYQPKPEAAPGPVSEAARSPRLMDDPYGTEAKAQVQRLEQELREELEAAGRPPPDEMLATPEGQAAAITRADEALSAIRDLTGIVPPEVKVQVFSRIDDLPPIVRANLRLSNAIVLRDAMKVFQNTKSLLERQRAQRAVEAAKRLEGIEALTYDNTIYLASYAMNPKGRLAHEVLHALKTTGRLSPEEIKVLADAAVEAGIWTDARRAMYQTDLEARYDKARIAEILEEEAAAHYVEAAVRGELPEAPAPETVGIIERLKQLFAQIRNALIGKGFRVATGDVVDPAQEVVSALMAGRIAKAEQRADWMRANRGDGTEARRSVDDIAPQFDPVADIQSTFSGLIDDIQAAALSSPVVARDGDGNVSSVRLNGQSYNVTRGPDGNVTGISVGTAPAGGAFSIARDASGGVSDIVAGNPDLMARVTERVSGLIEKYRGAEIDQEATSALVGRVMAAVANGEGFQDALLRELTAYYRPSGGDGPLYAMRSESGRMKPGAEQRAQDLDADLKDIENALKGASIDDREALQRKRAALLNTKAGEVLTDEVEAYRDARGERDPGAAFLRTLETHGQGFKGNDVATLRQMIQNEALEKMAEPIWYFRKGALTGDIRRKTNSAVAATMRDMFREAAGENTTNAAAKKFAKAWLDTADWLRQSFNAAGGDIGKLKGWFAPQYHDADALLRAGRDEWVNYLMADGVLSRDLMVRRDGTPLDNAELKELLRDIFVTITTDGANKAEPSGYLGKGAMYKRHAEHRVLHFKNADAFMKYADTFGSGDLYAMMIGHISMMSRDIAAMRRFGANPEYVIQREMSRIRNDAAVQGTVKSIFDDLKEQVATLTASLAGEKGPIDAAIARLQGVHEKLDALRGKQRKGKAREELRSDLWNAHQELKDVLTKKDMTPEQTRIFNEIMRLSDEMTDIKSKYSVFDRTAIGRANRLLKRAEEIWKIYNGTTNSPVDNVAASLMQGTRNIVSAGTLPFASISAISDQATGYAARKFIGMPAMRQLISFVNGFTQGDRKAALAFSLGLDQAHQAFATQARYLGWINTRSLTGYLVDRTHALSLLSPMTQAAKIGFGTDFISWMADLAKRLKFESLEPWTRNMLIRHGWTADDWAKLRTVVPEDYNGLPVLTRRAIATQVGDELADKYMRTLLRERSMAVLEPTMEGRAVFVSDSRPGTIMGEIARSVAMLKSFPTSYTMLVLGRIYQSFIAGQTKQGAAYGAAILFGGMALGALVRQMKNVSQGRDPENMDPLENPTFWYRSFAQSGGFGIYGDMIGNSVNRYGGGLAETLMGPAADRVSNAFNLTFGNLQQFATDEDTNFGREAVRFAKQNTPVLPFYFRTAYERMILDEIQKAVDPAAHRSFATKIRATKKLSGNDYYWPPGSPRPLRAPKFGSAPAK